MSKRYKGKTCAYCAQPGESDTADHVLARELVSVPYRPQIPKVPACNACNSAKAALEQYLATVLPFGGRHTEASTNLTDNAPRRLAKNLKLHRELEAGRSRIWSKEPSGMLVRTLAIPLDGERVERLVGYMVRGLMYHHWGVALGADCFVDVLSLTTHGEALFAKMNTLNATSRVTGDIGDGALVYSGAQGVDNPQVSIWEVSIYGGLKMVSADDKDFTTKFGVMTGPKSVKYRAEQVAKRRKLILPV